jgi:DNA-binding beta-propeller fold protein YncE
MLAAFGMAAFASGTASAANTSVLTSHGSLHHLFKQTGVYHQSETPKFVVDPAWPRSLPNDWILGQIGGLYVDQHDHIWVYNRPRTLTNTEAGALEAIEGAVNENGQPINGLGFARPYGPATSCCKPAPSVLEFDANGKLLRAWGGPADPGFIGGKCKEEDGCIWPNTEHGIYVDQNDNVWLAGNGTLPAKPIPWTTNKEGDDGMVLEFDRDGNFKKIIGGPNKNGENSNAKDGGINGTPQLYRPANMVVDPETNRLYIADGYGNRRIVIVDAETGKYIGHFGAYGNNPIDDAAADTAGTWIDNFHRGKTKPAFFRNPVHCVTIAHDGKLYVCDRGNNRIQVFDTNDPALGTKCGNPNGVAGKCGFIGEKLISARTDTPLGGKVALGTATSIAFSPDATQSCLYVADISNQVIYILNRDNLEELARLGHKGRMAGEFHWLHQISTDSKGNIYTGEVDTAKRIQKFLRYGKKGCSGTGSDTVGGFGSN